MEFSYEFKLNLIHVSKILKQKTSSAFWFQNYDFQKIVFWIFIVNGLNNKIDTFTKRKQFCLNKWIQKTKKWFIMLASLCG